jgi:hypothetical protein
MRSTYGFGRNLTSLRSQAIDFEFWKIKFPSTSQREARLLSSYHISFINYLDDMLSL